MIEILAFGFAGILIFASASVVHVFAHGLLQRRLLACCKSEAPALPNFQNFNRFVYRLLIITFFLIIGISFAFQLDWKTEIYLLARATKYGKKQVDKKIFDEKVANPPAWMKEQIRRDLEPFIGNKVEDSFSQERAEEMLLVQFKIEKGSIEYHAPRKVKDDFRFSAVCSFLKLLLKTTTLRDVSFFVSLHDSIESVPYPVNNEAPLFVFAKKRSDKKRVLMPDYEALLGNRYKILTDTVLEANGAHPWETKEEMAIWRGTTTGGEFNEENWGEFPRSKLVLLSKQFPGQINARFNNVCQANGKLQEVLQMEGMMGATISVGDHLNYKYLLDVDGNSCGYSRCFWGLLSNSVLFKQESENMQWYYGAIEPYKHYIPITHDFSDLFEKIEWAKAHDREVEQIAEEATEFVLNNLSTEDILVYMKLLLDAYAQNSG